jgi:hypothetical protein
MIFFSENQINLYLFLNYLKYLLYTDCTDLDDLISKFLLSAVLVRHWGVFTRCPCCVSTCCLINSEYGVCCRVSLSKFRFGLIADIKTKGYMINYYPLICCFSCFAASLSTRESMCLYNSSTRDSIISFNSSHALNTSLNRPSKSRIL